MYKGLVVVLLLTSSPAFGAVFQVEKDGSGDFTVIQHAVNAAASGDTIMIGPGRYDDGEIVSSPGWTEFVRVLVRQSELTIIGSGAETTIIGPDIPYDYATQGHHMGIESGPYWGNNTIKISNLGFENMAYGVRGGPAPSAVIEDCRFSNNAYQLWYVSGGDIEVSGCLFNAASLGSDSIIISSCNSAEIKECRFELDAGGINGIMSAMHIQSTVTANVTSCVFDGGYVAMHLSGNGASLVSGCTFRGQSTTGPQFTAGIIIPGGHVIIRDSLFENQDTAIITAYQTSLELFNTKILDVTVASLRCESFVSLAADNCIFAHGPDYAIWQSFPCDQKDKNVPHFDLTNNDWGTTDAEEIASFISTCSFVVDYIPYIGQPVATENLPFGSVKAMYR